MELTSQAIYRKHSSEGLSGLILGALEYASQELRKVTTLDVVSKGDTGDLITNMDRVVQTGITEYFRANNIRVLILGEEGYSHDTNPEYVILLDAIEGTANAVHDLDYGTNIAIARYRPRLFAGHLEAAAVANWRSGKIFVAERGKGAHKLEDGVKTAFNDKVPSIYELPSPFAYTTKPEQITRQQFLTRIFYKKLGNQPRSIDATGVRLVEIVDRNVLAYGDWRNATKCWDVLPAALILSEAGFQVTDVLGFSLGFGILYDKNMFPETGGLNKQIGENFIVGDVDSHHSLIFGEGLRTIEGSDPVCSWDVIINQMWEEHKKEIQQSTNRDNFTIKDSFTERGKFVANVVDTMMRARWEAYGNIDVDNILRIYLNVAPRYISGFFPHAYWA